MANCRVTPKNTVCDNAVTSQSSGSTTRCEGFSACLAPGRDLSYNGTCLTYTVRQEAIIPDGTYNRIEFRNGCIYAATDDSLEIYTPGPCAPDPTPCSGSDDSNLELANDICNMLSWNASGQLQGLLTVQDGDGVITSGCGTALSPLVINIDHDAFGDTVVTSGTPTVLSVTGSGASTSPYIVSLVEQVTPSSALGFTWNSYGQITGYTPEEEDVVRRIIDGQGITSENSNGVVTISLDESGVNAGDYLLGGWRLWIDLTGRVTQVEREIVLEAGDYDLSNYVATVNPYGSIVGLSNLNKVPTTVFTRVFTGSRYDMTMTINTEISGSIRLKYRGFLGASTPALTGTLGLGDLPAALATVTINGIQPTAYAVTQFNTTAITNIVGVEAITQAVYGPGEHTISISITSDTVPVTAPGIMDVELVSWGG